MKNELVKSLGWEVNQLPLQYENIVAENKQLLVRSDNKELLGITSRQYNVITNKMLERLCGEISKRAPFVLEGFAELQEGKKVLAFLRQDQVTDIMGESTRDFLLLGNSFDSTKSFFVGYTQHMIRCENQFSDSEVLFRVNHKQPLEELLTRVDSILQQYETKKKSINNTFERFRKVSVTSVDIENLVKELIGKTKKDLESSRARSLRQCIKTEIEYFGSNAWGLFSGVTRYTTNELNRGRVSFGVTEGLGNVLNRRAFELLK